MFGVAVFSDGVLLIRETAIGLGGLCTEIRDALMEALVDDVATNAPIHDTELVPDSSIFFGLSRSLKRHFSRGERDGMGQVLAPLGLLYLELLDQRGLLKGDYWDDEGDACMWFEAAWCKVRYAQGETLMASMLEKARNEGPTVAKGTLGLFIRVAWHLQREARDKPIYLPVNEPMAELFGTSPKSLSDYIRICVERGYLELVKKAIPHRKARMWMFKLDHPDFNP